MLQEERQQVILAELERKGAVKVATLSEMLNISESTIRRDINELDNEGRLKKVFGGAVAREKEINTVEEDVITKSAAHVKEKKSIAKYAASLINDNDFVFIDAGTTTEGMIDYIDNYSVTYVTNGVTHGEKLAKRGFKVYITGGQLKKATQSIVGATVIEFLEKCNFTKCFMGANGIDVDRGFTTPDFDEATVKAEALKKSYVAYVLADGSKFGCVSAATFGKIEDCCIITDKLNDDEYKNYTIVKEVE